MYENLIKAFEDIIKTDDVFHSFSFDLALNNIENSKNNLKFLIGVPGTGKSFLVKFYEKKYPETIVLQGTISKEELNEFLYSDRLIIIDEAQLLDINTIEYIRTLTDTKEYSFLLSMHSNEAKEILNKEHFKSRSIDVIELQLITKEEMIKYINSKLLQNNSNYLFLNKEFNIIYNYTNGNFRYIKKFVKTLFELFDFALKNNFSKYKKINSCLLTMTAIKLGLENE